MLAQSVRNINISVAIDVIRSLHIFDVNSRATLRIFDCKQSCCIAHDWGHSSVTQRFFLDI